MVSVDLPDNFCKYYFFPLSYHNPVLVALDKALVAVRKGNGKMSDNIPVSFGRQYPKYTAPHPRSVSFLGHGSLAGNYFGWRGQFSF